MTPTVDDWGGKRIAYADPPYPGQAAKHYRDHADYAGEVDHYQLVQRLGEYDGWVLHTSSPALSTVLNALRVFRESDYRVMAWVKPFAAFKKNVPVAYAWEPVLIKACRKPTVTGRVVMRDFISCPMTMKRGLAGAKPREVCRWAFEVAGAQAEDDFADLFPGTGAVSEAWNEWCNATRLTV